MQRKDSSATDNESSVSNGALYRLPSSECWDEPVGITLYEGLTKVTPKSAGYKRWHKLKPYFLVHQIREAKDGTAFSPHILRASGKRCKRDVEYVTFVVLDYDDGRAFEARKHLFSPYLYVAYSTFSHTPDFPKYRVVIALTDPVQRDDWPAVFGALKRMFPGIDPACGDASRLYFIPSCPADRAQHAWSVSHDGVALDPFPLIAEVRRLRTQATADGNVAKVEPLPVTPSASDLNDDLTTHAYPDVPAYVDSIVAKCNQAKQFKETGCAGNEPLWHGMIGAFHLAVDSTAPIHEFSSVDPSYSYAATQRKIDSCINNPTTCAHIESLNPSGCVGCPSKGKVTTPLQLGRVKHVCGNDGAEAGEAAQSDAALQALQAAFALISAGSGVYVIDMESLRQKQQHCAYGALVLIRRLDGTLLLQRYLKANFPHLDTKSCIPHFMTSPNTTMYDGVDFRPGTGRPGALNLWVGPTLVSAQGQWNTLRGFLLDVICAGDDSLYTYLIRYLAHALQYPEEKPGVMITLLGGQGIGKGTLFALIMKIWAATTLLTSRINDVVGDFNDSLEGCMFVLLDESHFAGDQRSANALKSLATNPEVQINPKGQPTRKIHSTHRLIQATNNAHAGIKDADDRRGFVLRVSETRKGDREYWKRVYSAVETESPALMHDLLGLDLSSFNVRQKPDTGELTKQKIMSLPTIDAFWYDCLYSGALPNQTEWPTFVSTASLVGGAKEFAKGGRNYSW